MLKHKDKSQKSDDNKEVKDQKDADEQHEVKKARTEEPRPRPGR